MIKKILLIIVPLLFLSGCAYHLTTDVRIDQNGKILVEEKVDQPTIQKIEDLSQKTYLAYQGFTKKDWGIVVTRELSLSISSLSAFNEDVANLTFSFTLPGKILKTNADKIENGNLFWTTFKEDQIYVQSRQIRWWLITGLGAALFLILFYYFTKRK